MRKRAIIKKVIDDTTAEIFVERESACGKNCGDCGGCGTKATPITAKTLNIYGAREGDRVLVESNTANIIGIAAFVYILPLVLFFTGYFAAYSFINIEAVRVLSGFTGFAVGLIFTRLLNSKIQKKGGIEFKIISVCD